MTYVCLCGNGVEFRERVYVAAVLAHRSRRCGRWAPRCGCQFPRSVPPSSSCQDRLRGPHRARHIPASSTSHMRNQCGAVHMLRPSSALPSSPCRLRSEALPPPSYSLPPGGHPGSGATPHWPAAVRPGRLHRAGDQVDQGGTRRGHVAPLQEVRGPVEGEGGGRARLQSMSRRLVSCLPGARPRCPEDTREKPN